MSGEVIYNLVIKCVLRCRLVNVYQHIPPPSHAHPVHLKLVLYVDFHTTHGTRNIKIVNWLFLSRPGYSITPCLLINTLV